MQVEYDTSIVGQVTEAILQAESEGKQILVIRLTSSEMKAFIHDRRFDHTRSPDTHYGAQSVVCPARISPETDQYGVPLSCNYMGVELRTIVE